MVGLGDGAEEKVGFTRVQGVGGVGGVGLEFGVAPAAGTLLLVELGADWLGGMEVELVECAAGVLRGLRGVRAGGVGDRGWSTEMLLLLLLWVGIALALLPLGLSGLLTRRSVRRLALARIALLLLILLLPVLW